MRAACQGFQVKDSNGLSLPSNMESKHPAQTRVPARLAYLGEEDYRSFINPIGGRRQEAVSLGSHCCFYYSSLFSLDNAPTHMQSREMCGVQT